MSGRLVRSILNFSSKRLAKLFAAHLLDQIQQTQGRKSPRAAESCRAGLPRGNLCRSPRRASAFTNSGTIKNSNGSWISGVFAKPLQIQHRKHRATLHENSGTSRLESNYPRATRTNVATMRAPATNVPRNVPETFDSPPARRRWFTRDFENAQPGARLLHLHLQIPAVRLLAHVELSRARRGEWREMGTCRCNEPRRAVAKSIRQFVRTKICWRFMLPGSRCPRVREPMTKSCVPRAIGSTS